MEEAERNVIGVEAGLQAQGLGMYLILAVGLSDESDILSVEELRVAWCPSLAYRLLKLQRVAAFREDAGVALVLTDFVVLLKHAGEIGVVDCNVCHNVNVLRMKQCLVR